MLEIVDSVTAVMQSVTEKGEVRTVTERIEARESGVAMQAFSMVESVPVVDAMGRAEAKSHPGTMAEATPGAETATGGKAATSCLDRHHHPSQDETPDKEGEHNSSPHTLPEKASECVVRRRLCRWWAVGYGHASSIRASPGEGLSLSELPDMSTARKCEARGPFPGITALPVSYSKRC